MTKTNQSKAKLSTKNSLSVRRITLDDDLAHIASQCNADEWGDDSELLSYSEATLRPYLADSNNVLVGVFDKANVAGIAIGYILVHPSGNKTLYIDELDTHPRYRRQGVATMMMNEFTSIARTRSCLEVWLSSSRDNVAAHAFYKTLHPTEQKEAVIFGYNI